MKYKYLVLTIVCSIIFFGLSSLVYLQEETNVTRKLELSVIPSKVNYMLGEVVTLSFKLTNKNDEKISIIGNLKTSDGYLNVYLSQEGDNYRKYIHSKWGTENTKRQPINFSPNENVTNSATILWNSKRETEGLNNEVAKKATEGRILTHYAFPESGTYFVKASYYIYFVTQERPVLIESEPIQITIEEPVGEDLEVWNIIKDNGDFAYFLQESDFKIPSYKTNEREKFRLKIERILNQYPNSFYTNSLEQSLDRFKASEAKRLEFQEKMKAKS